MGEELSADGLPGRSISPVSLESCISYATTPSTAAAQANKSLMATQFLMPQLPSSPLGVYLQSAKPRVMRLLQVETGREDSDRETG